MKKLLLFSFALSIFAACDKPTDPIVNDPPKEEDRVLSVNGKMEYIDQVEMADGPHQLLINNGILYAKRDHQIFSYSLNNAAKPVLQKTYKQESNKSFGKMFWKGNSLYACNAGDGAIYVFDASLNLQKKYTVSLSSFKPNVVFIDASNNYWIGGSNGANGILAKAVLNGTTLNVTDSWQDTYTQSNIEWIAEKDNTILASAANGNFLSFFKADLASGPVQSTTFDNEAGHEKWGKSFYLKGDKAYWGNWGAGLATLNVSNATSPVITNILSHSLFKNQYPNAEGTDVYDVTYNSQKDVLCVANGWSGVLLLSPNSSDQVMDYIDPQYFQNMCIATSGPYIYTGNISGGMSGKLKGIMVFKLL